MDFNNFCYTKSWRTLTQAVLHLFPTPAKCHYTTSWIAELVSLIRIIFCPLTPPKKWMILKTAGQRFIIKLEIHTSWCGAVWRLLAIRTYARSFFEFAAKPNLTVIHQWKNKYNFTLRTCTFASDNGQDRNDTLLKRQCHSDIVI